MVFDDTRDLRDVLRRLGHFFAHESCGKCYPCQMGTERQKEVLERLAAGRVLDGDLERLEDIGWTMTDASLCGLGQTAAGAVLSAIKLWPSMFSSEASTVGLPAAGATEQAVGTTLSQVSRNKRTARATARTAKRSARKPAARPSKSGKKPARRK